MASCRASPWSAWPFRRGHAAPTLKEAAQAASIVSEELRAAMASGEPRRALDENVIEPSDPRQAAARAAWGARGVCQFRERAERFRDAPGACPVGNAAARRAWPRRAVAARGQPVRHA